MQQVDKSAKRWQSVLPWQLAFRQAVWEEDECIARALDMGADVEQVAKRLGVTRAYVKWRYGRQRQKKSPIEKYLAARGDTVV